MVTFNLFEYSGIKRYYDSTEKNMEEMRNFLDANYIIIFYSLGAIFLYRYLNFFNMTHRIAVKSDFYVQTCVHLIAFSTFIISL